MNCVKVVVVPGCTFAHFWRVTLELVESELSLVTLWWANMFDPLYTFKYNGAFSLTMVISGEPILDASSLKCKKLKWGVSMV